jgi:hypothetical protein
VSSTNEDDLLQRIHDALETMGHLAGPEQVGSVFGAQSGLESAINSICSHLRNADEARAADQMLIVDLLTQVQAGDPQQVTLEVMGASGPPVPGSQALELAGAAVELIRQMQEPGSLWRMWEERDDVALEILAWHCVARLRLATAGHAPPVSRPLPSSGPA